MAKISRPAVYTFVGAVAVYAWFVLTQPDAPTPVRKVHVPLHAAPGADDLAAADLSAHFARYQAGKRDPFLPHLPASAGLAASKSLAHAEPGKWALTGISSINGVPNALVEDSVTGDSVFLKPGDRWHGLRVLSIGTDAVAFINALGQQTSLAFRPLGVSLPGAGASEAPGGFHLQPLGAVSPLPVSPGSIRPLPPLPSFSAPPAQKR